MTNGFRYIKEMLMQIFNNRLQESYDKLKQAGIKVYTVKTDAFTIKKKDLPKAIEILNIKGQDDKKEIGDWRISNEGIDIKFPHERITMVSNALPEIKEQAFDEIPITVEQEYDTDYLCSLFEEKKRMIIRAELPGSGKSYACEHLEKRGHKVLFVCPTNKLACKYKKRGITINKKFGIGLSDGSRILRFDTKPYDAIIFDEIFFSNIHNLRRIRKFCEDNPEKIILATGDTDQLEPIEDLSNVKDFDKYSNACVNMIFKHGITLKENKRLKSKKDRELLKQIKKDMFNTAIPIEETIRKYFKVVSKLKTQYNVAYKNKTCADVNYKVREMLGKKKEYEVKDILVCRKFLKLAKQKVVFNVNYEYEITQVAETAVQLDGEYWVPLPCVRSSFIHNQCRTCHSLQGSSLDDEITIFDWKHMFIDRKWIWTSLTRCTELNKVYFWDYEEKQENVRKMTEYFEAKIHRYKGQDLKAGRTFDASEYIDVEWLKKRMGKACCRCGDAFGYELIDKKPVCNLTAQRLNNDLPHLKSNCIGMCAMCNKILSDHDGQ
jgi:hypothetical protein